MSQSPTRTIHCDIHVWASSQQIRGLLLPRLPQLVALDEAAAGESKDAER